MKDGLSVVVLAVAIFMGFLMGYSLPPMLETGMIGGKGQEIGLKSGVDQDVAQHYKELLKETE